jgi:uncharacterized linocin/CFP29 family protein
MTSHLFRELAPVTDEGWHAIDEEAARTLRHFLAARRLVDFDGPLGYDAAAVADGRLEPLGDPPSASVVASRRATRPLIELHAEFSLSRAELDGIARGASDPDLDAVTNAARHLALAEDSIVFEGYDAGGIRGIAESSPHPTIGITDDYNDYPGMVARAVATLQRTGIGGPYALALGPRCYTGVIETTELGGYPVLEHLRLITGGPVVWAPAVDGAIVLSTRGDDFELSIGEDVSIAYVAHDTASVYFRLEETLSFRTLTPEAAVALRYG